MPVKKKKVEPKVVTVPQPVTRNYKKYKWLLVGGLVILLFWWKTNTWPIVAVVDGTLITRFELNQVMYSKVGQDAVESLVLNKLISQELKNKKVNISSSDVDARLNTIKKQVGSEESFQQALAFQGMTEEQLKQQIKVQVGLEKLVAPSTDSAKLQQEVSEYLQTLRSKAHVWIVGEKKVQAAQ